MPVGTLISVWEYFGPEIWWNLKSDSPETDPWQFGKDEYRKVLSELNAALKPDHPDFKEVWEVMNGLGDCEEILGKLSGELIKSETVLLRTISDIYINFKKDIKPRELAIKVSDKYAFLLERFFKKFSLRYSLRKPFEIIINIESIFSDLYQELERISKLDDGTRVLLQEFEEEFSELLSDVKERKVKSVISKASNFTERFLSKGKNVRSKALSKLLQENCGGDFPHPDFKAIAEDLYGFSCDLPGIRHGGGQRPMLRNVQLRDAVLGSILYLLIAGHLHPGIDQDKLLKI